MDLSIEESNIRIPVLLMASEEDRGAIRSINDMIEDKILPWVIDNNTHNIWENWDITNRDLSISGHFETLLSVQDKQSQINTDIRSSMEKVTLILSDLSEFFNRDFEGAFEAAVETINERYKHRFDEIFKSIKDMNEKIRSSASSDQMTNMMNNLKEEVTSVSSDLGDRLATMDEKSTTIFDQFQLLENKLSMMSASFKDAISNLVRSITDYKDSRITSFGQVLRKAKNKKSNR